MENKQKMNKKEKVIWTIATTLLVICTFVTEKWEVMAFLKLPSYILGIAEVLSLLIRNLCLKGVLNINLLGKKK